MNKYYYILLFCCSFLWANSQTIHRCGHDHAMQQMEQTYPGYTEAVKATFNEAKEKGSTFTKGGGTPVYTIPVVVHVVWKNPTHNISDDQIYAVMNRLNEDYRQANANQVDIRTEFDDVANDSGIEFCLQEIKRVETTASFDFSLFGSLPDNVKQTSEGGSDAVDPSSHLNIWVCFIGGGAGLLGYAYPPAGLPNWPAGQSAPSPGLDGVVVHAPAFNIDSEFSVSGTSIAIEGRTLAHEVGHYLGLRHIWGDGLTAQLGIPDCSVDDEISDTPNQGIPSQFACNATQNSCTEGNPDLPDMYENYMDYADETCMSTFTVEQAALMRGVLENERNGLINNTCSNNSSAPEVTITSPDMQVEICVGESLDLMGTATNSADSYFWNVPGGTPKVAFEQNPTIVYNEVGTFDITFMATNEFGTGEQVLVAQVVVKGPEVEATASETTLDLAISGDVDFTGTSATATSWEWDFGDGSDISTEQNPSHTYTETGTYTVTLTVFDGECPNTTTLNIEVEDNTSSLEDISGLSSVGVLSNPFNDDLNIRIHTTEWKDLEIGVFDALGRRVVQRNNIQINGSDVISFDASDWTSGVYFLRLNDGQQGGTIKLLKL